MAKLISLILLALFIIITLLAVTTTATTYTTTITTTRITGNELETPTNSKCKLERAEIIDCLMYLSSEGDRNLQECCSQLEEVKSNCQCKALKEVLWQIQHQKEKSREKVTPEDMEQIEQFAQDLPRRCFLDFKEPCVIVPDPSA